MADWVTISALATAGGTLVLAVATFSSVRSANRSARVAERSLMAGIRPVLMPSRLEDPPLKVGFADDQLAEVPGGERRRGGHGRGDLPGHVRCATSATASRCCTAGASEPERQTRRRRPRRRLEEFHRLTRDIYIPVGDVGFWQGVFRDPRAPGSRGGRRRSSAATR